LASPSIHHLTYTLVLYPIAAGLFGLSVLFGLCGVEIWSSLATLVTFVAFVLEKALFSIAQHEFRKLGWTAEYGNARYLSLPVVGIAGVSFLFNLKFKSRSTEHREQYNTTVTYPLSMIPGSGVWRR
jgi:hypothetical protein